MRMEYRDLSVNGGYDPIVIDGGFLWVSMFWLFKAMGGEEKFLIISVIGTYFVVLEALFLVFCGWCMFWRGFIVGLVGRGAI